MTISDIAHQRLANQHLSRPDFGTPAEVVRWFGAVQAQDFLGALYAIGLRMPDATQQLVEKAVADRTIVRSWPMRGTIHFMPSEDARWMLELLAHRQTVKFTGMYRRVGLTPEIVARAGEVFAKALQGGRQLTRKQLYEALAEAGIETQGEMRGLHLLGYWAQEGLICLGPRVGKQHTFTLLEEWIPKSRQLEGEEALAVLAGRYFVSHGPATANDFAWWTGLTLTEARLGLKLVERELVQETVAGRTYWSGNTPQAASRRGPDAYLLPPFDEFTVAYRDRSAVLDPTFTKETQYGLSPSIIVGGRMVGTWKRTLKKDAVLVTFNLFAPLGEEGYAAVVKAAHRYGSFLGLPVRVGS